MTSYWAFNSAEVSIEEASTSAAKALLSTYNAQVKGDAEFTQMTIKDLFDLGQKLRAVLDERIHKPQSNLSYANEVLGRDSSDVSREELAFSIRQLEIEADLHYR
jgi:hypothetical protein